MQPAIKAVLRVFIKNLLVESELLGDKIVKIAPPWRVGVAALGPVETIDQSECLRSGRNGT